MDVYIVWERRNYTESSIILITDNEEKAKELSGQEAPSDVSQSIVDETDLTQRSYGIMKLNKLYETKTLEEEAGTIIYY